MNEATLRRLQERMLEEGHKAPSEEGSNEGDDPAAQDDEHDNKHQPQQISMYSQQQPQQQQQQQPVENDGEEDDDAAWIAEQVRRHQEYFLQQQQERFGDAVAATSNNNSVNQDNDEDREDGEDWWNCESCGYDSAAHLNFCGVCGDAKPHDWFCHSCNFQNSHFHRFCGMCGKVGGDDSVVDEPASVQQSPGSLGYEDMGLPQQEQPQEDPSIRTNEEEEAAIRDAAERMSRHLRVAPVAPYGDDDDDVSSFAGDSCEDDVPLPPQHQRQHQPAPAPSTSIPPTSSTFKGWCCLFCTFQNENPDFLSCEMCGSARPPTPPGSPVPPQPQDIHTVTTATSTRPSLLSSSHSLSRINEHTNIRSNVQQQQPPPRRESYGSGSRSGGSSKSDSSEKIKEKRLTEILRLQHLAHTEASIHQQQQQHSSGGGQVEPETDHELAMIYAQQERILAEYQRHQRQQQQR